MEPILNDLKAPRPAVLIIGVPGSNTLIIGERLKGFGFSIPLEDDRIIIVPMLEYVADIAALRKALLLPSRDNPYFYGTPTNFSEILSYPWTAAIFVNAIPSKIENYVRGRDYSNTTNEIDRLTKLNVTLHSYVDRRFNDHPEIVLHIDHMSPAASIKLIKKHLASLF